MWLYVDIRTYLITKRYKGNTIVNAGVVGKPKHGNGRSTYVIVDIVSGTVCCEIREVSYDLEKIEKAILENPYISNELVKMLKQGF